MRKFAKIQKWMARRCMECKLCRYAREKQSGVLYRIVELESVICPFCRAYEKVYGKKSYEPYEVPNTKGRSRDKDFRS